MTTGGVLLKYVPFETCVDPTFWHKLVKLKLDIDMLEEKARMIWGSYSPQNRLFNVDCSSFNKEFNFISDTMKAHGYHLNVNTAEAFKQIDKVKMLEDYGQRLIESIKSGQAVDCPSLLATFVLLTFGDLKKYHFYYWFAFPASTGPQCVVLEPAGNLTKNFTDEQVSCLFDRHAHLQLDQQGYFSIRIKDGELCVCNLKESIDAISSGNSTADFYWGFVDPCDDKDHPGWPLRNFLLLIYIQCPALRSETLKVVCLRKKSNSIFLKIRFTGSDVHSFEKWIGWETNLRSKFGPKFADLSLNMNPTKLAEESVGLNLRLMKWRLAPDLQLEPISAIRCLLLGAGTLGCSVARSLLAWGVVNITFVDNGIVSYSNPVRQSLYTFQDCQKETYKAEAAASALKIIYPSVNSKGLRLSIPMPGRGVNDLPSLAVLEQLVQDHDVVFLLTDTRESRWLPTLLATKYNKIAITAALGFDTYLVMRHGLASSSSKLGCYFCNDVTAPGNSGGDRTLDQQCTVTRPGVSLVAAALAVEIMVGLLQHTDRGGMDTSSDTCLGPVPHSIRGFLSSYSQILPSTPAFSQCTACSSKVVEEYKTNGIDFLEKVLLESKHLEDITGLTDLHSATAFEDIMGYSDDEEM